jgi:hypothetical protein
MHWNLKIVPYNSHTSMIAFSSHSCKIHMPCIYTHRVFRLLYYCYTYSMWKRWKYWLLHSILHQVVEENTSNFLAHVVLSTVGISPGQSVLHIEWELGQTVTNWKGSETWGIIKTYCSQLQLFKVDNVRKFHSHIAVLLAKPYFLTQ